MTDPAECPMCSMSDLLRHPEHWEYATCGHEWQIDRVPAVARVIKDANGNLLSEGDSITLIKDLKLKGSSKVLKGGSKSKGIRLVEGDHEIFCKIDGVALGLKACFVRKA